MKTTTTRALALTASAFIAAGTIANADQTQIPPTKTGNIKESQKPKPSKRANKADSAKDKMAATQSRLALENALAAELIKKEHADLQAEVARLKLEKELLTETLAIAELEQKKALAQEEARFRKETTQRKREASLAKMEAETLGSELKAKQAEFGLALADLEHEIKTFEANKKREDYVDSEPVYLADPLLKNGTLVISDRRIDLNGPIFDEIADHVTERINYYNNKNDEFPIFIVINNSPGGSVMSGMRIMKSMHGSEAPVYVVVKSFAASMAASLTTLAERSFAYPNAIILHHQVLSGTFGNLTETREHTRQLEEWWRRLANPIAKKMGISREEFIDRMYENTVSGDWTEFADQAKKLKWVDHVVSNIKETSLLKNPDARKTPASPNAQVDANQPSTAPTANIIPRLNPKDVLYLYNPDGYYQPQR